MAILAAVIAIGVLAYIGVFSPGGGTSTPCVLNAPFGCDESAIGTDIQINIRNGGCQSVNISEITVTGCTTYAGPIVIADGEISGAITISCGLVSGEKVSKDIHIIYQKTLGGTIDQTATGTIRGKVA